MKMHILPYLRKGGGGGGGAVSLTQNHHLDIQVE